MSTPKLSPHGESLYPLQQPWTMAHQPGANPLVAGVTTTLKAMAEVEAHQDLRPASQVSLAPAYLLSHVPCGYFCCTWNWLISPACMVCSMQEMAGLKHNEVVSFCITAQSEIDV